MAAGRADAGLAGAAPSPDLRAAAAARRLEPALRHPRGDLRAGGADRARAPRSGELQPRAAEAVILCGPRRRRSCSSSPPTSRRIGDPEIIGLHISPKGRGNQPPVPGSLYAWAVERFGAVEPYREKPVFPRAGCSIDLSQCVCRRRVLIKLSRPAKRRCPMTTQSNPYPRVEFLIDTFADWLKHRRELNEMRGMDRGDFDRIADDLRVSPGDLDELVRRGPHAADELPQHARRRSESTRPARRRLSRWCCATWSASARCATTRRDATAISPPAPPPNIMRAIASTRRPSIVSARPRRQIGRSNRRDGGRDLPNDGLSG